MTSTRRQTSSRLAKSSRSLFRRLPRLELLEQRALLSVFNPLAATPDGAPGSLRAAIIAANSNHQNDTINLQAGTYNLAIANVSGQENAAAQGDLDLTDANH